MKSGLKFFLINSAALALFVFDRLIKRIFFTNPGEYFIFSDFLKLKLALNHGVAFGLGAGVNNFVFLSASRLIVFLVFLILIWCLIKFYRQQKYFFVFCFTLIIFGALSNLLDRFYFGAVVDYFDLKYFTVFNLADVMIVFGILMLLLRSHRKLEIRN